MKKLFTSFSIMAICLFTSFSAFAQDKNAVEVPAEAKQGATIQLDAESATPTGAPQVAAGAEVAPKPKTPAVSGNIRNYTVYAYMYCESKGGDDGSRLEPYGYIQVLPINAAGGVFAPPLAPTSSLLMNRGTSNFISIKPGQSVYLGHVKYQLNTQLNTRFLLRGHLKDDDTNADDGLIPNTNDDLGTNANYLPISSITSQVIKHQRYVSGTQIVWVTYYINPW